MSYVKKSKVLKKKTKKQSTNAVDFTKFLSDFMETPLEAITDHLALNSGELSIEKVVRENTNYWQIDVQIDGIGFSAIERTLRSALFVIYATKTGFVSVPDDAEVKELLEKIKEKK